MEEVKSAMDTFLVFSLSETFLSWFAKESCIVGFNVTTGYVYVMGLEDGKFYEVDEELMDFNLQNAKENSDYDESIGASLALKELLVWLNCEKPDPMQQGKLLLVLISLLEKEGNVPLTF